MTVESPPFVIENVTDFEYQPLVPRVIGSCSCQTYMVTISDSYPRPFIAKWPSMIFKPIGDPKKCIENPTCVYLSYDGKMIVTGHQSGNLEVFLIDKPTTTNIIKREDKPPIIHVSISTDYLAAVVSDSAGNLYQFTHLNHILPHKEILLCTNTLPIENAFLPTIDSSFLIFNTKKMVHLLNMKDLTAESKKINGTEADDLPIHFDAKLNTDNVLCVTWYGPVFEMFEITDIDNCKQIFKIDFERPIKRAIIRANFVVTILMEDGSIELVVGTAKPVVEHYESEALKQLINTYEVMTKSHERFYLSNTEIMQCVLFLQWRDRLKLIAEKGDYPLCFHTAVGIYTGTNLEVFGIPSSASVRCQQIHEDMSEILEHAIKAKDDLTHLALCLQTAAEIELPDFITKVAYNYMKEKGMLDTYYSLIFGNQTRGISQYLPFSTFKNFLEAWKAKDQLADAEKMIINTGIPSQYATGLLQIALEYDMHNLLLILWTQYLHDFISPCIYLYKRISPDENEIIEYVSRVMLKGEEYNVSVINQKVVMLWFFTSIGGSFIRLKNLFYGHWDKAPTIISKFLELLPTTLRNGTIFDEPQLCDSLLRFCATIDPNDSFPIINIFAHLILKHSIQIPPLSVKMMIQWLFSTRIVSTTIRESILLLMQEQYPDSIKIDDILNYCEAAGFSNIVIKYCIDNRDYDRVIQTMAVSPDRKDWTFLFIQNPYRDPKSYIQYFEEKARRKKEKEELKKKQEQEKKNEEEPESEKKEASPKPAVPLLKIEKKPEPKTDKIILEEEEDQAEEEYQIENDEKMKASIKKNLSLLVLINPKKAANLISRSYPEYHRDFLTKDAQPYIKFLYMRAFSQMDQGTELSAADQIELFRLTCQYSPMDVLPMLKTSHTIQIDEALPVCTEYRVIDACIHIHTMLGDMQSAVNLVADELEFVLVEAINSGHKIIAPSIDLVKEAPELKKAYDTVIITFDLLSKAPEVGQLLDRMWKDIFLAFQLPLWLSSKIEDVDTKSAITLFFAFFVVESLTRSKKPENILEILRRDFSGIDIDQYRQVLSAVFKYLDYQEMLSNTVIELLLEDCIDLYKKAVQIKSRAAFVYHINCVMCNTPITGQGGVGGLVFECGHLYHDNASCGNHKTQCPLCHGEISGSQSKSTGIAETSRGRSNKQRQLQRVEFGLRRHYGKDQDMSESGNNIFFLSEYPVEVKKKLAPALPKDPPEQTMVFLEL